VIWEGLGRRPDFDSEQQAIVIEIGSVRRRDRRRDDLLAIADAIGE
jgi:hypothetical protein